MDVPIWVATISSLLLPIMAHSIALNASDPDSLFLRASVYNRSGKYRDAEEDLDKAIALKTDYCDAYKPRQDARTRLRDPKASEDAAMAAKLCRP